VGRRSGLGKGLGALIPATERLEDTDAALRELPVSEIRPNSYQPREHFDEEALVSLAASIQAVGVLQPILVRQSGPQEYELIAGERRWRAARRAGLQTIPAIVRPTEDVRSLEQALVENLHREDLTPLEEAAAYQQLIEEFGHTQEEVAQRVGKSRSAVANTLRLLHLPPSIQRLLAEGQISAGHARALLGTPDRVYQEQLARAIVAEHLTVREVEDRVRQHAGEPEGDEDDETAAPKEPVAVVRPAALLELEDLLSNHLDTRVQVSMGAKRGRVVVDFATLEDLERIYRVIVEGPEPTD
jgi:ParB family transcriptional regulator, chromosome partitioning protein